MKQSITTQKSFSQLTTIYALETKLEFLKAFRQPSFSIPSLVFPLMFYVFFGLLFNKGGQAPTYLLATYGVFGVIGPALFSFGVSVAIEKDQGWLALKQVSPIPISAYLFAKVITAMMFGYLILLGLFALGALFGDVKMTTVQWLSILMTCLVGSLSFCGLGLWIGLTLKAQSAPAIVNLIYLPMAFLSGLWIPIHFFPDFLQSVAWFLPAFHLAQLTLGIQGNDLGFFWGYHLLALSIMSLVFFMLAHRAFKKIV